MGLILVWDMDDTLSHSKCVYNSNAIGLLEDSVQARPGLVDAIILLTDNSDQKYVKMITDVINVLVGTRVFDIIVDRTDELRLPTGLKDIQTVRKIVEAIGKSTENLEQRILFFDDLDTHPLSKELANPSQFIHVKWAPLVKEEMEKDMTDYSFAENLISPPPAAVGGSCRRRRAQQHQVPLKLTRRRKRLGRSLKSRHAV
jgi:hypothetical protein